MDRVAKVLAHLAAVLNHDFGDTQLSGYLALLRGVDPEILVEAIQRLGRTSEFFPRPAKILDEAKIIARDRVMKSDQIEEVATLTPEERERVQRIIDDYLSRVGNGPTGEGKDV